jgi:hypothetical protein
MEPNNVVAPLVIVEVTLFHHQVKANTRPQNLIFQIFLCGQHHCKVATWLAAPLYWWVIKASVKLAAHHLISRPSPYNWARIRGKEIDFTQYGFKIKRQKGVHHSPSPIHNDRQLPDPPSFSLVPNFKVRRPGTCSYQSVSTSFLYIHKSL